MSRFIVHTGKLLFPVTKYSLSTFTGSVRLQLNAYRKISSAHLFSNSFKSCASPSLYKPLTRSYNDARPRSKDLNAKNRTSLYYLTACAALVAGFTYLSVLLYRLYCQTTGKGGQAIMDEAADRMVKMKPVKDRRITVNFNADVNSTMRWNFKPQQPFITVSPGETALAFYKALNPMPTAISGVATYNVLPFEAGKYFNKIQCFCFEEQQLNPNEEVDMPVFFYLDPAFVEDPRLENVNDIILSYTFFEAKEGMQLPRPSFV